MKEVHVFGGAQCYRNAAGIHRVKEMRPNSFTILGISKDTVPEISKLVKEIGFNIHVLCSVDDQLPVACKVTCFKAGFSHRTASVLYPKAAADTMVYTPSREVEEIRSVCSDRGFETVLASDYVPFDIGKQPQTKYLRAEHTTIYQHIFSRLNPALTIIADPYSGESNRQNVFVKITDGQVELSPDNQRGFSLVHFLPIDRFFRYVPTNFGTDMEAF